MPALAGVSLRPEAPADDAFLLELYASTRAAELALTDWTTDQKEAFVASQFAAQRAYYRGKFPEASFDVIERGGSAVGRLYVDRSGGELRIVDIALVPAHRGQGLGRALIEWLQQDAATRAQRIVIHVEANNPARRLYDRLGFVPVRDVFPYVMMAWVPAPPDGARA